ncbi:MAG TPA: glycerol-3-phosphate dehydrogenase/oxidase [Armatimonadota bacterium]|jgi:glycerol-3-phosphate dehydrogenase
MERYSNTDGPEALQPLLDRSEALDRLSGAFDVLIIGGGATGLGVAVDSAARGYSTALVEAKDYAHGTSSRSTKLVHGGVRYLKQGNVALVREALHERYLLARNAPHLVRELRFLVPVGSFWEKAYYAAGLKMYDALAGRLNLTPSRPVGIDEAMRMVPTLAHDRIAGGVAYSDAQFNDSRLAVSLARTAAAHGAVVANYARVRALLKDGGRISGAVVEDVETGREITVRARVVVNATGVGTDAVRSMDDPAATRMVQASQGIHIVLDRSFLPGDSAIMVPKTADGRVFFLIPWEGRALAGTTDTPVDVATDDPMPLDGEVDFVLEHAARYLSRAPQRSDVLSVFAGLRPLVKAAGHSTAQLSRDHTLVASPSGLVTITGGKWTTYRHMAADAVSRAAQVGGLPVQPCRTGAMPLHGALAEDPEWAELGAAPEEARRYAEADPGLLHPRLPYTLGMAAFVIDNEAPVHLEDVLSRRLRALLLNAEAAVECAPAVAARMAGALGRDAEWARSEVRSFTQLAGRYQLDREACHA